MQEKARSDVHRSRGREHRCAQEFLHLARLCDWKLPTAFGDPRIFQILFLGILLAAGAWLRDF